MASSSFKASSSFSDNFVLLGAIGLNSNELVEYACPSQGHWDNSETCYSAAPAEDGFYCRVDLNSCYLVRQPPGAQMRIDLGTLTSKESYRPSEIQSSPIVSASHAGAIGVEKSVKDEETLLSTSSLQTNAGAGKSREEFCQTFDKASHGAKLSLSSTREDRLVRKPLDHNSFKYRVPTTFQLKRSERSARVLIPKKRSMYKSDNSPLASINTPEQVV